MLLQSPLFLNSNQYLCLNMTTVPPMILDAPVDMTLIEGGDANFTCRVTGRPRPSIVWLYLESPLMVTPSMEAQLPPLDETTGKYTVSRINNGDRELMSTLTVVGTLPSDTGFYVCLAENEALGGVAFANASLTVQRKRILHNVTNN